VHKHLPKEIYREKMHNPYRGGTPDVWYSGPKTDMWIEYKWQKVPKSGVLVPELSALQSDWLIRRTAEGRKCYVIVGTPDGAHVLTRPLAWTKGAKVNPLFRGLSDGAVADWITGGCR
jgi:hypothetical protein